MGAHAPFGQARRRALAEALDEIDRLADPLPQAAEQREVGVQLALGLAAGVEVAVDPDAAICLVIPNRIVQRPVHVTGHAVVGLGVAAESAHRALHAEHVLLTVVAAVADRTQQTREQIAKALFRHSLKLQTKD